MVAAEPRQYLTFTCAARMYAVETLSVKEIIEYGQVTTVPMMPPTIRGVINPRRGGAGDRPEGALWRPAHRGYPAYLHRHHRDGWQRRTPGAGHCGGYRHEVLEIPPGEIEAPPPLARASGRISSAGWARWAAASVILLNVEAVLSTDELSVLDEAVAPGAPMDAGAMPQLGSGVGLRP